MIVKRKLADGRVITWHGKFGEPIGKHPWRDEQGNIVEAQAFGEPCVPFENGLLMLVYDDDGKRINHMIYT